MLAARLRATASAGEAMSRGGTAGSQAAATAAAPRCGDSQHLLEGKATLALVSAGQKRMATFRLRRVGSAGSLVTSDASQGRSTEVVGTQDR